MKQTIGVVTSTKMAKTAVVLVERFKLHPIYKKRVRIKKKYHAHNEIEAKEGDQVKISPCRPISKTKKWKIVEIIKKKGQK
jgi:small subunit ribosomal protein S17